jgi:hypothetical protein
MNETVLALVRGSAPAYRRSRLDFTDLAAPILFSFSPRRSLARRPLGGRGSCGPATGSETTRASREVRRDAVHRHRLDDR